MPIKEKTFEEITFGESENECESTDNETEVRLLVERFHGASEMLDLATEEMRKLAPVNERGEADSEFIMHVNRFFKRTKDRIVMELTNGIIKVELKTER